MFAGDMHYLWRAVDHEGEILESYITKTRDKAAALVFMKKALKRHGSPEAITTDSLGSYRAAMKVLDNADKQEVGRWANNRAAAIRSALAFRVARLHRLICFDGLHRFCLRFQGVDLGIHFDMHGIPSADTYQHTVGMFDGVHMPIMLLDHLDRRAHLLGHDIDIDSC